MTSSDFAALGPIAWELAVHFLTFGLALVVAFLGSFGIASVLSRS